MSGHRARPANLDPARAAACDALLAVQRDDAYLNLALPRLLRDRNISGRDAAFATEIAYGTARRWGVLSPVISAAARRPAAELDDPVAVVLHLGAYQILHTRVPTRAAVSSGVEAIRRLSGERPAGLVNAVLRRVGESDWEQWVARLAPAEPIARIAFRAGYPSWIAEAFVDALVLDPAGDLSELAAALDDSVPPIVHLVARPGRIDRDVLLAEAGPGSRVGALSPYAVHLGAGDPGSIASIRSGAAAVQDEGSQLVALALAGTLLQGQDTGRWLDVCAGPGGKSALLEGLLPAGGRLLSVDLTPNRARLTRAALISPHVVVADGRHPAWPIATFDRVLIDAPCSGLGALRRRPEARWRKTASDVDRLAGLQQQLLAHALDAVRPGGVVAYSTCSPHHRETSAVVDAVLASRADVTRLDAWAALPPPGVSSELSTGPGEVQLWPHRHGTDAMFVALLRRGVG